MPWSIFTQGGGNATALSWAESLLSAIGAPLTPGNVQFVYDWEVSEGGGGKYNPLNQGPVPGHPELTTTGEQYGGGAADFASWEAGLQGAVDYLQMPAYRGILSSLQAGDAAGARSALISSQWASGHYGSPPGSNFSTQPVPGGLVGQITSLPGSSTQQATFVSAVTSPAQFVSGLGHLAEVALGVTLILFGVYVIVTDLTHTTPARNLLQAGRTALVAVAAAA